MRVAAFLFGYPPTTRVGAPLMTAELLEALAAAGHHVRVYSGDTKETYERNGVEVQPNRIIDPMWLGADVVIAHPDGGGIGLRMSRQGGAHYVGIVHNVGDVNKYALDNYPPSLIVYNAEATRDYFGHDGIVVRSPLRVAEHRVDRSKAAAVTLVNLKAEKGADVFYELARRIDAPFLGVQGGYGEQDVRPDLAEIIAPIDHCEMPSQVWARTRVLLVPSMTESWGRAAVEALCSGIPIVAAPTPGLVEALGDAAVFVDRDDLDGWEIEVRRLLDDPDAAYEASCRSEARASALEELTSIDLRTFVVAVEDALRLSQVHNRQADTP